MARARVFDAELRMLAAELRERAGNSIWADNRDSAEDYSGPLEQIRGDRMLHEALAVRADPLHLAAVFNLSTGTGVAYADIARRLLERPVESSDRSMTRAPQGDSDVHAVPRPGRLGEPAAITDRPRRKCDGSF